MTKYRVLQIGDRFYPQHKRLWLWCTYREGEVTTWYLDLESAKIFLAYKAREDANKKMKQKITIHPYP